MAHYDFPLEELRTYKPPREQPDDFNSFWEDTLLEARRHSINFIYKLVDYRLKLIEVYDISLMVMPGNPLRGG